MPWLRCRGERSRSPSFPGDRVRLVLPRQWSLVQTLISAALALSAEKTAHILTSAKGFLARCLGERSGNQRLQRSQLFFGNGLLTLEANTRWSYNTGVLCSAIGQDVFPE
jgi:hypothetical protein